VHQVGTAIELFVYGFRKLKISGEDNFLRSAVKTTRFLNFLTIPAAATV
jgi:hypothetical protein